MGTNSTLSPTQGTILLTTDGGATWTNQKSFTTPGALTGVTCLPQTTTCYAVGTDQFTSVGAGTTGPSYVVGTSNAGPAATWTVLQTYNSPPQPLGPPAPAQPPILIAITCTSISTCYATGTNPYEFPSPTTSYIVTTNDGWATRAIQSFTPNPSVLFAMSCPDPSTCYAVGGPSGAILAGAIPASPISTTAIPLAAGWNLIGVPVSPTVPLHAQNVVTSVVASSGGNVAEVASWQGSGWATYLDSGGNLQGSNNFTVQEGQGYFLYSDQPATITVTGLSATVAPTITLTAGWNLIATPTASNGQTASTLLDSLTNAGLAPLEAAHWTGSAWQTLVQTSPGTYQGTDFPLNTQQGYFVYVQNPGPWQSP